MLDKKVAFNRLLKKFGDTGTVNRLTDSGGPRSYPHWRKCWPS